MKGFIVVHFGWKRKYILFQNDREREKLEKKLSKYDLEFYAKGYCGFIGQDYEAKTFLQLSDDEINAMIEGGR